MLFASSSGIVSGNPPLMASQESTLRQWTRGVPEPPCASHPWALGRPPCREHGKCCLEQGALACNPAATKLEEGAKHTAMTHFSPSCSPLLEDQRREAIPAAESVWPHPSRALYASGRGQEKHTKACWLPLLAIASDTPSSVRSA